MKYPEPKRQEAGAHLRDLRQAFGDSGRSVTVEQHRRRGGREQSTLEGILRGQGHSLEQIYAGKRGERLIDRVTRANNLGDPNQIRSGQRLMVPASESRQQADRARLNSMLPPRNTPARRLCSDAICTPARTTATAMVVWICGSARATARERRAGMPQPRAILHRKPPNPPRGLPTPGGYPPLESVHNTEKEPVS